MTGYDHYLCDGYDPEGAEPEPENESCPICCGDGVLLGRLGNVTHYRCRNCGMQFAKEA
jgi:hypothetical protein